MGWDTSLRQISGDPFLNHRIYSGNRFSRVVSCPVRIMGPTKVRRMRRRVNGYAPAMSQRHRDVIFPHDTAPHPSDPADIPVSTLRVNLTILTSTPTPRRTPTPTQMITMLRKLAMVIHFFVWSVCYAKPKEVSRRDDNVCGARRLGW